MIKKVCLIILLFYSEARAQIVNIENHRLKERKEGWSGNFDLGFSLTSNTRTIYQLSNRNNLIWRKANHSVLGITDFSMVIVDKTNLVNNGFQHLRYAYNSKKYSRIYLEGFQQLQYNRIQLIDLRMLFGGGSRAIVIDKDSISLNLGAFIMAEYEEQTDDITNIQMRYSCFISFDWQLNKTTGINTITYYQPDVFFPGDYRLSSETSLRLSFNKRFRYRFVYNISYDKYPPETAPKTIYFLQNVFSYEF